MPKRKTPWEWTTDEAMRHLFPKKVVERLKALAHAKDADNPKGQKADSSHQKYTR